MTKKLILTNLSKIPNFKKKDIYVLGNWVKSNRVTYLKYHWDDKNKLIKNYDYLKKLSEKLIFFFYKKLNSIHNEKNDIKYWRIILSPWISVYISSMFDRWETINLLKKKKLFFSCDYFFSKKIFSNYGLNDYIKKVSTDEIWNHSNFVRIIEFLKIKNIKFVNKNKLSNLETNINTLKKIKNYSLKLFIDKILSYFSLFFNSIIIENFYINRFDYLKLCFRLLIFPGLFISFFSLKKKSLNKINLEQRSLIFKVENNKQTFNNFLLKSLNQDFPTAYLEDYKYLKKKINTKGIQFKKVKKIFSMVSFIDNEIFKIWLANKVKLGAKLITVSHGGCLTPKLNGFFDYFAKISNKVITRKVPTKKKEVQLPILKKINYSSKNFYQAKNIYIFDCEPVNYPCKIQSWPFISSYNNILSNTIKLIKSIKDFKIENICYRSMNNGANISEKIKNNFPKIKISNLEIEKFDKIKKDIKIAICMYPETVIVDLLTSGIPTLIYIPNKMYIFDKKSEKIINLLKKNQIYFDNLNDLKNHLNNINQSLENLKIWWFKNNTQEAINKFQNQFFLSDKDYIIKWQKFIKKKI